MEICVTLFVIGILGMQFKPVIFWTYKELQKDCLIFCFYWGNKRKKVILFKYKREIRNDGS